MSKPIATIVIPASRDKITLHHCLDSLEKQTKKNFRVILVFLDNPLTIDKYSFPLEVVTQKKPGLVQAMNEALEKVKTNIFIRIDDDVIADPQWFENIIKSFDKDTGGVTGPTIIPPKQLESRDLFKFLVFIENTSNPIFRPLKFLYLDYLYEKRMYDVSTFLKSGVFTLGSNFEEAIPKHAVEVNNLEASNFAVRTELLKAIKGFDQAFAEGLGEYHEADVAFKIRNLGYKIIFNPRAKVIHNIKLINKPRSDSGGRIYNFILFYKRHIKLDSIDKLFRFTTNILLQNCYYFFTFIKTGDIKQLSSISGTLKGILSKK